MACLYCPQQLLVRRYRELTGRSGATVMPWDVFQTCLKHIPKDVDLHFSGYGEPWLHPQCTKMILEAHRRKHRLAVFTTAIGLAAEDVSELEDIPFKRFSVHVPDANRLMRCSVDHRYLEALARLRECRIANLDFFSIGPTHPAVVEILGDVSETRVVTTRAENVVRKRGVGLRWLSRPQRADAIVCRKDRIFQNVLLPSGHVALCCMDYGLDHILGNLLDVDYHDLHRSAAFTEILERTTLGGDGILCGRCDYAVPGQYRWQRG
jgi:hypothetical protein